MGQLVLGGQFVAGPPQGGDSFPGVQATVPLSTREGGSTSGKGYGVATGILERRVSSPSAFVALQGVGPTDTVTQGNFLYVKTSDPVDLRLTQDDGSGGTVVNVESGVHGLFMKELSDSKPLELLEIKGTATLEYFVCGRL